jgi:hypothetical protein
MQDADPLKAVEVIPGILVCEHADRHRTEE